MKESQAIQSSFLFASVVVAVHCRSAVYVIYIFLLGEGEGCVIATVFRLALRLCGDLNLLVVKTHINPISPGREIGGSKALMTKFRAAIQKPLILRCLNFATFIIYF